MKNLTHVQTKNMPQIKLITFDLDDTFWDVRSVIINAEKNSRKWIEDNLGQKIEWGSFDEFMTMRAKLVREDETLEYDLGMLRKKTILHHTHSFFKNDEERNIFINKAYNFFLHERHQVSFYKGVLPALKALSKNYQLGVLTNGNADVGKLDIGRLFSFSISSVDVKSNKPGPAHFLKAKELSGIDFENTLHVGDHPINDIKGARDLGINTMWFNSQNLDWELDEEPPIEFNDWSAFMNLLSSHYE